MSCTYPSFFPVDRVASERGYPAKLRVDNGPELTSIKMADWAQTHGVELEFIQPGKPMQNGFIERFNRTYREEVLDMYVFNSIREVREITEAWLRITMKCVLTSLLVILRRKNLRLPPLPHPPEARKELNAITTANR